MIINHFIVSAYVVFVTTLILAFFVVARDVSSKLYRIFFAYTSSIALWSFSVTRFVPSISHSAAFYWGKFLHVGAIMIPIFFLHFVFVILKTTNKEKITLFCAYSLGIIFQCLNLFNPWLINGSSYRDLYAFPTPGRTYFLFFAFFIVCVLYGIFRLIQAYYISGGLLKNQLIYLILGSIIGYAGGLDNFAITVDWRIFPLYPFGAYTIAIYTLIMSYAITKHRLMNISVVISRALAWLFTVLFLGSIYLSLVWLYRTFITAQIDLIFLVWTVIYGILVGHNFQRIRIFLQTTTDRTFIKGWYDYRRVLRKAASGLGKALTREDIVKTVYPIFQDDIDIAETRMFFLDKSTNNYMEWDPRTGEPKKDRTLTAQDPPIKQVLTRKNIMPFAGKTCVPSFSAGELVALFILGKKRSEDEYTDDDLEILRTISEYTAIALEYIIKPYEEVKQKFENAQEKLVEAEKQLERSQRLSSLGRIISEVAHEINNPLSVIASRTEKLGKKTNDPGFVRESAELVTKKCDQIAKIVRTMRSFAQPPKYEPKEVDILDPITSALRFMPMRNDIKIMRELKPVSPVLGDSDELERVFINLFTNAYDAMSEKGGKLTVRAQAYDGHVKIEVEDTGCGIPKEDLPKIFEPFYTSKFGKIEERTGFGLSICHNIIVEKHGGTITAESAAGKGTKFTIILPAAA
jgi:signal transduction histidine kinase